MLKLFCVVVGGVKGNLFPVNMDTTQSVGELMDAIKAKMANALKGVDADQLRLFLAKETDGEWLSSGLEVVNKLKKGETTSFSEALTAEDNELQAENFLETFLTS
ncbi:hypothetical protein KXD40_001022 [Peronospora effusa]|uniref:Crinkler effector protein N-terminal domain-containing protein n=1 Tax=Peronospora effusa TaxID=542832 RepID=A0A3M6VTM1_9STRA|nr:hypothetical protein DD238_000741 [Peronospora effusa]RQM17609.1 hypothetical protein DD237_001612 [Peronospora effusa]UIZ20426.1 hypothetical protein KXD40_001022 [Peronospora effusa]CAI5724187.1 unnamed protein product [Peronospora effusa]